MGLLVKKLGAGAITIALVGCGGGNESDAKLSVSGSDNSAVKSLSGVVMDGYLQNANVCVDKNVNSRCDSGDGAIVQTDSNGDYSLPIEGDVSSYKILVEAISGVTVDLDNPGQVLLSGFTLEAPSDKPQVVSPMTSMISSLAETTGTTFDEAAKALASDLNVSEQTITSDYVGNASTESKEIHMLARGITRVLQSAQEASVSGGVTEEHARKGSLLRLANLDVVELKKRTDTLSHGAANTEQALEQIGSDYESDLKITPDDISGDKILTKPAMPKQGVVDDAADTFDWSWVRPFNALSDYEYSLDNGTNWQVVNEKPLKVGSNAIAKGAVQVRVAANPSKSVGVGKPVVSDKAFTPTLVPSAPSNISVNDANNTFDWVFSSGFTSESDYEFSTDNGTTWVPISAKPQTVADISVPAGELKVRVRGDNGIGRPAGLVAKSTQPMTVTPDTPVAPSLIRADDSADVIEIGLVSGFDSLSSYEIDLGSGWQTLLANPYQVGNVTIAENTIKIRVKADDLTGRLAGQALTISTPFNEALNKPASPMSPVMDNANNLFGWSLVTGFDQLDHYELSLDGGNTFQAVSANPESIPDQNYAVGSVCVRVKAGVSNDAGSMLCNTQEYTVTPNAPAAPTGGVVDDAANTFDWSWVTGFESAQDYEYRVESGNWQPVSIKPISLLDKAYAQNSIEVRVKSNPVDGRPAGQILSNQQALTKQPDAPVAPSGLVVDDTADTLDWAFVTGFTDIAQYEWSANSGVSWTPVSSKPISVGDLDKAAGTIQVRVRANSQNGMPAGLPASNTQPFTAAPKLPAPNNVAIKVANNGVSPNMIGWDYVNSGENYNQPSHYEFTVDQGATWQTAVNNPQFVGPKAYDKSTVGIRLKDNAIAGKDNSAGETFWATTLTGPFVAIQYVPMELWNQASGYSVYSGWNSYDTECIAEYDAQGTGEPTFWVSTSVSNAEDVFSKVSALTTCGIKHWQLPSASEVITLSKRSRDNLPSHVRSYLISDYQITWANESGTPVAYKNGVKDTSPSYYGKYAFVKWQLASGAELMATVTSELAAIDSVISSQTTELDQATSFLTTWVTSNRNKQKSYSVLSGEAATKLAALTPLVSQWETKKTELQQKLDKLTFEASIAQSRTDNDSTTFITKVAEFSRKFDQVSHNNIALSGAVEATSFAEKLANIQQHTSAMSAADNTLAAASSGSAIHQATLDFYAALFDIENDFATTDDLKSALNGARSLVDAQFVTLIAALDNLLAEMDATVALHTIDTLHTTAKDGLNRAHTAGYQVSQADALIDGQFAKLDMLGRYLPKATTYAQGWRCVLDTNLAGKNRTWSLLRDGMPGGNDETVFNAAGADMPSVMGSGGKLEAANNANLCGHSDWKLPHPTQLETLATATVSGLQGASTTVDVNVFPHHKALLPEYDKSYYSGGTRFFYWTNVSSSSSRQNAYVFANTSERPELRSFDLDGDSYDQYVTLARFMREDTITWEYIGSDGNVVASRALAQCAKDPSTGHMWQLFQNATPSERYKNYSTIKSELATFNAGVCGKTNWSLPSINEFSNLIPTDVVVFPYASPTSSDYSDYDQYVTSGSTESTLETIEVDLGESTTRYNSSSSKFLYRFIAK